MNGWLIFLALLAAYVGVAMVVRRRQERERASALDWPPPDATTAPPVKKHSLEMNGPFIMYRTQFGKKALERVARPRAFWNVVADAGVILTWVVGALIFVFLAFLFVVSIQTAIQAPSLTAQNAQSPEFLIGIPGVNPLIPVGYGAVAIILALVIHEGSHGVMAYASRMRVKSLGLLFFIVPIGAFVEPDEEDLERSTTREKNRVFAAGPTSNIVLALVAGSLLSLVFLPSLAVANGGHGVVVATVESGSAADLAGLQRGDVITAIDHVPVGDQAQYRAALDKSAAGQQITVDWLRHGKGMSHEAVLTDRYDYIQRVAPAQNNETNRGKGFLGIAGLGVGALDTVRQELQHPLSSPRAFLDYNLYPLFIFTTGVDVLAEPYNGLFTIEGPLAGMSPVVFFALASVLYWIVWINVTLATFNALPMGPLDGGQMFRVTLRERLMKKYGVDHAKVHVERAELGGIKVTGRDEATQAKLDRIQGVVRKTTWTLGLGILSLILVPILVPHVLRLFY